MRWDLSEKTEEAIAAYLKTKVPGTMRVSTAFELNEPQYPCAVVSVMSEAPISDTATWHDARMMAAEVHVITEAADEIDANGTTVSTMRERNAEARSVVMDALATTGLLTSLNNMQVPAVAFSMAQVTTCTRNVDDNMMWTTINLEVIAEPVEGT